VITNLRCNGDNVNYINMGTRASQPRLRVEITIGFACQKPAAVIS
jgi:hypothetical protein